MFIEGMMSRDPELAQAMRAEVCIAGRGYFCFVKVFFLYFFYLVFVTRWSLSCFSCKHTCLTLLRERTEDFLGFLLPGVCHKVVAFMLFLTVISYPGQECRNYSILLAERRAAVCVAAHLRVCGTIVNH